MEQQKRKGALGSASGKRRTNGTGRRKDVMGTTYVEKMNYVQNYVMTGDVDKINSDFSICRSQFAGTRFMNILLL